MKTRLIDAEALKRRLLDRYRNSGRYHSYHFVVEIIDEMPTESGCGHWESVEKYTGEGSNTYKCSECGFVLQLMDGDPVDNEYAYCPYCGSRLIEEEKMR